MTDLPVLQCSERIFFQGPRQRSESEILRRDNSIIHKESWDLIYAVRRRSFSFTYEEMTWKRDPEGIPAYALIWRSYKILTDTLDLMEIVSDRSAHIQSVLESVQVLDRSEERH